MYKTAHLLRENKNNDLPKWVIFFDTETSEDKINDKLKSLKLKLGYAALCRKNRNNQLYKVSELDFTTQQEFYIWLSKITKQNETYRIVAHNIEFDFRIINGSHFMPIYRWKLEKFIHEGINFIVQYSYKKAHIIFINNQQYFNVSLKELGKSIGLEKLEVSFDTVDDDTLRIYCHRDVDIMIAAWNKLFTFIKDNDLGNFAYSTPGQAFNAFRHRFNNVDINIHNSESATNLERSSYHGGRVEAFFIGKYYKSKVYYLDVNSMYPYVMMEHQYPTKLITTVNHPTKANLDKIRSKYLIIADVDVSMPLNYLPAIKDERLIFPTGIFNTTLAEPELNLAEFYGIINSFNKVSIYETDYIFKDYVKFFYSKRLEYKSANDKSFEWLSKLMLNSLYGKFGQRNTIWVETGLMPNGDDQVFDTYDAVAKLWYKMRVMSGVVSTSKGFEEGFNSFVAIASFVTSYARVYLQNIINRAGDHNVLYCDTDSVFVNQAGYDNLKRLINPNKLGALKLVEVGSSIMINGAKDYKFNNKSVIKGISKSAVKINENTYTQQQFEGYKGAMRNKRTNTVIIKDVTKKLSREYTKGIVTPSGWVEPHQL